MPRSSASRRSAATSSRFAAAPQGDDRTVIELLRPAARQSASLGAVEHRPWPLPERPWLMGQTWEQLLFAHWRVPPERLRPLIPAGLELDRYDGGAWLGITPFRITNLRLRGTLPVPWVSSFRELNVRTCVTVDGKPGIWFFSLDCESPGAVEVARRTYHLPYVRARMSSEREGDEIEYSSARCEPGADAVVFHARYGPVGPVRTSEPGTLEWFLTERYCLYAEAAGRLYRADIHHAPWPLQPARATIELNTMAPVEPARDEPVLHYSERLDTVIWPLERI
jgi:uncharacterized protein YqjF (DUF2071 family)